MSDDMKAFLTLCNLNVVDGYSFETQLTEGNATTSLLYKKPTGERIVIKMLIAPRGDWELTRFQEEPETLARLNKHGTGFWQRLLLPLTKVDGLPIFYFGVQYLEGITLNCFIEQNPLPWTWQQVVMFMWKMCRAFGESMLGHVHRDLHFSNILLTDPKNIFRPLKVGEEDYGIAILDAGSVFFVLQDIYEGVVEDRFRLPGGVSTWSPEMLNGQSIRYPHDTWGLGIMLHTLLTGKHPIEVESIADLFKVFSQSEIPLPMLERSTNIPEGLKMLSKNLLSIDPGKRLLSGEIASFCEDAIHHDLLDATEILLKVYIASRGGIVECICGEVTAGGRCGRCQRIFDWDSMTGLSSYKHIDKIYVEQ